MKSVLILLDNHEKVRDFVKITEKYDFDIDIRSKKYIINAKSLLGIFGLGADLSQPIVLEIYTESSKVNDLLDELNPFILR